MRAQRLGAITALVGLAGCQLLLDLHDGKPRVEGSGGSTTSVSASSGQGASTTSSGGGATNASSTTSTTGTGGGGASSTASTASAGGGGGSTASAGGGGAASTGSGGAGGNQPPTCSDGAKNGAELDIDCGGPTCAFCPTVLLLGAGNGSMLGAEMHPSAKWTTKTVAGGTMDGAALTITTAGKGIGLIHSTEPNSTDHLQYTAWTDGSWTSFTDVGPGITTMSQPTVSAGNAVAQAAFHGTNFKYYYMSWNGTWSPIPAEPIGQIQNYGPVPPDLAARGADATLAFVNGLLSNDLYAEDRNAGMWVVNQPVATNADPMFYVSPAIAALTSGPELMMVFVRPDKQVRAATRTNNIWALPVNVPGALTQTRPALAALAGGGALLAFRGTDGFLYYALYSGGAWSATKPFATPNVTVQSPPSVARGIIGAEAELAYVDPAGKAFHARLVNAVWSAPVQVGAANNLHHVALTSAP